MNNIRKQGNSVQLTEGSIPRSIFHLAIPMIVANTFNVALELIDAVFVGRLGSETLAAVAMAGVVMFLLATFGMGLGIGSISLISRAFGEKNFQKADRVAVHAIYLGVIVSLSLGTIGFFTSPCLLRFLGATGKILHTGTVYLKILFAGLITMYFMFLGSASFQGAGDTKTPMKISAFCALLNIILDPIMIFGFFHFPRMEAAGAALATVISRSIGGVIMLYILHRGNHVIKANFRSVSVDWHIMKKILTIGFPGSIQMLLRSFSALVLVKIAALFGTVVLAVYGVGGRVFHFFLLPGFGFGGAAATLVGQNLGAKNPQRAERSSLLASFYYLLFLSASSVCIFVFSRQIAGFFNSEKAFIDMGAVFLRYVAVGSLFLAPGIVFSRALQGAGETVQPMLATGISLYVIQIPLAYLLAKPFGLNENGIWIASVVGHIAGGIFMTILFFRGKWKHKKL